MRRLLPIVVALVAALVFVMLTDGGRESRQTAPTLSYISGLLETLGLGLNEVTVTGQHRTLDRDIYDRLQLGGHRSVWLVDTEAARARVETLPWVQSASLKRVFPDRLHVDIQERRPRAVWSDGSRSALIDASGRILGAPTDGVWPSLPVVFGAGAPHHADAIIRATSRLAALRGKVTVFEWSANRRWTLHLKSGQKILLPAHGQSLALVQMTKGRPGRRLIDTKFETLDLRIASQAAITLRN